VEEIAFGNQQSARANRYPLSGINKKIFFALKAER
jgi:hypothetical protein